MRSPEIVYTEHLLNRWGQWSARNADLGLGYNKENAIGRMMRLGLVGAAIKSGYQYAVDDIPETVELTDRLVLKLPSELRAILICKYLFCYTDKVARAILGMHQRKYREQRQQAIANLARLLAGD